jgi:hypothetical protein
LSYINTARYVSRHACIVRAETKTLKRGHFAAGFIATNSSKVPVAPDPNP